jgi:hypothetical protein
MIQAVRKVVHENLDAKQAYEFYRGFKAEKRIKAVAGS